MDELEQAMKEAQALMDLDGVVGVGEGEVDDERCILVFVDARSPELDAQLPVAIRGFPVRVHESGRFSAL